MFNRTLIKRSLIGGFLACFTFMNVSGQALAAKPKEKEKESARMPFDGLYIGGSASLGVFEAYRGDNDGYLTDNSSWISTLFTPGTGLQIGHDWQKGTSVFGIVGDIHWLDSNVTVTDNPNTPPNQWIRSTLSWMVTLRGRVGMANEDMLLYLTGGVAASDIGTIIQDVENHSFDWTRFGLAGGVGAEFVLMKDWNLGGEFLHTKFAPDTINLNETGTFYLFDIADSTTQVKVSVNYRF